MSTITNEVKKTAVNEKVEQIKEILLEASKMDGATGINAVEADPFEKTLVHSNGLELQHFADVDSHRLNVAAAANLAAGTLALEAMKANTELKTAEVSFNMGGSHSIDMIVHQSKEYRDPKNADNKIIKHGVVDSTLNDDTVDNKGQFKKARTLVNELFSEHFSK